MRKKPPAFIKKRCCTAFFICLVALLSTVSRADDLRVTVGTGDGPCAIPGGVVHESTSGEAATVCNAYVSSNFEGSSVNSGVATGDLSTGIFGAYSTAATTGFASTSAESSVQVEYNFDVPNVLNGTAVFTLAITGIISSPGCCDVFGNGGSAYGEFCTNTCFAINGDSALVVPVSFPIDNGKLNVIFELQAYAGCFEGAAPCSSSADFLDPLSITGASVYDASGSLIPGVTLVSESGFNPNAAVPEPAGFVLLGTGLAGLTEIRRRRSR